MKILIIGGTKFLGRHLVSVAKEHNHSVTIFNRGKHTNEVFDGVEQIQGDRNFDLDKLKNRNWDAVIDTCGFLPKTVKQSAEALKNSVGQYVFISSISAYADFSQPNFDETTPTAKLTPQQQVKLSEIDMKDEINGIVLGEMYGALKVLCEEEAEKVFAKNTLIIRSGLIVGEFDWTDRFSYWVMRVANGGEVLAPGNPKRFIQFIDARDLADWLIKSIENKINGIFNVTGNPNELTMGKFLDEIKSAGKSNAEFTWVSEEFLNRENVAAWNEMPLYLPESDEESKGFLSANTDKALVKGLTFRPLHQTINGVLKWRKNVKDELKAGISFERERELLELWHKRK